MGIYRSIALIEPVWIQEYLNLLVRVDEKPARKYLEAPSLLRVEDLRPSSCLDS